MPRLLLVMLSAHPGMVVVGDGVVVVVVVEDEAGVVVEEAEGGIMIVMPKRKERESNRQQARKVPRRGNEMWNQMADLMLVYEGMLLLRLFKVRKRPSWTMDLLLLRSRTSTKKKTVSKACSSPVRRSPSNVNLSWTRILKKIDIV